MAWTWDSTAITFDSTGFTFDGSGGDSGSGGTTKIVPLADLKRALRLTGTAEDTHLRFLEAAAAAYVERETGRYYSTPQEGSEWISGVTGADLWLAQEPATDPAAVVTIGGTVVDAADYEVRGRRLVHSGAWSYWPVEVKVVYTAGYALGSAPADIQQAVTALVVHWFANRAPDGGTDLTLIPDSVRVLTNSNRRMVA